METRQVAMYLFTGTAGTKVLAYWFKSTCLDNHSTLMDSPALKMKSRVGADILFLLLIRFTCYEQDNHSKLIDSLAVFPLA